MLRDHKGDYSNACKKSMNSDSDSESSSTAGRCKSHLRRVRKTLHFLDALLVKRVECLDGRVVSRHGLVQILPRFKAEIVEGLSVLEATMSLSSLSWGQDVKYKSAYGWAEAEEHDCLHTM